MIKKRLIPILLLDNGRLIKTKQFDSFREVGSPISSAKVYSNSDADELVFLNIARHEKSIDSLVSLLQKVSEVCFMPLAVGGGIKSLQDAEILIKNGADKVIINSACYDNPNLISQISDKLGAQAVIVAIDVRLNPLTQEYQLYSDCGRQLQNVSLQAHIEVCTTNRAGEIMIQSIDKDGMMTGYDIELIKQTMNYTRLPVIASGGSGNYEQLKEAFLTTNVSALGCGSIFNFSDSNPIRAKAFLSNYAIPVKLM